MKLFEIKDRSGIATDYKTDSDKPDQNKDSVRESLESDKVQHQPHNMSHEFHETCRSVTFNVLVNSQQR